MSDRCTQFAHLAVTLDDESGLRVIRFNKPGRKNAISRADYKDVIKAFGEAERDEKTKVVVLTGTGDYYSSGADRKENSFAQASDMKELQDTMDESAEVIRAFVAAFIDFPKLLVAVVNGPAIGIAATTLALCDLVYCVSASAYVWTPFVKLALVPEGCSSYTYPRIMGPARAVEVLVSGKKMPAGEAAAAGLFNRVDAGPGGRERVMDELRALAKNPLESLVAGKRLVRRWDSDKLHLANLEEVRALKEAWRSERFLQVAVEFMNRKASKM